MVYVGQEQQGSQDTALRLSQGLASASEEEKQD